MQPMDDVIEVMRLKWRLFRKPESSCGMGGGRYAPTFILSVLGSACANEISSRMRIQYFQTVFRMVQFVQDMRMLKFYHWDVLRYSYFILFLFKSLTKRKTRDKKRLSNKISLNTHSFEFALLFEYVQGFKSIIPFNWLGWFFRWMDAGEWCRWTNKSE